MKLLKRLAILSLIFTASSCAMMFNKDKVNLTLNSNPQGADIFIEGVNYGQTPKTIRIKPKNYNVSLTKEGFGSAQLKLETWVSIREKSWDGTRCFLDAFGAMLVVPLYSLYWSGKCLDFKKPEYMVNIPYTGPQDRRNNSSYPDRNQGRQSNYRGYPYNSSPYYNQNYNQNNSQNVGNYSQY